MFENETNRDLASKLLISYMMKKLTNSQDQYQQVDFDSEEVPILSKIIYKRMEALSKAVGVDGMIINIPDEFYLIIEVMADGPGCALVMLYKLIESAVKLNGGKLRPGYTMDESSLVDAFPIFYDTLNFPKEKELWNNIWDSQKDEKGRNKVDQVEYWIELFDLEEN